MSISQVIAERRTVHDYASEPVSRRVLEQALQAATEAPNHRLTEPWRFLLVGPGARQGLIDIAAGIKERKAEQKLSLEAKQRLSDKILKPAYLVVACQVQNDSPTIAKEDYAAIACGLQNFMLVLAEAGVGSKWSTGQVTSAPETYELLGIDPSELSIVGFVWVGMPARELKKAPRRKGLDDIVREIP